jgi:histidinol-phosphate phosphatase family protein
VAVSAVQRAVFLDKDGTLIEDVPYNVDPSRIRLTPGAPGALQLLSGEGFRLIVVTNQSGVGRGYFEESALAAVEEELRRLVRLAGAEIHGFYYCPHLPVEELEGGEEPCACRKPLPGLLYAAAAEHGIDLEESWLVGDIVDDVEAGRRAGCRTVLVGEQPPVNAPGDRCRHFWARDLSQAARTIARESCRTGVVA